MFHRVSMRTLSVWLVLTCVAVFIVGCGGGGDSGGTSFACGSSAASTAPIKGPAPGASGNDSDNPFRALAIHPNDPLTLYVGSEGNGLFKSSDGGVNWTWLRSGLLHCDAYPEVYSIAINQSNPSQLIAATNAGPGLVSSGITSIAGVYKSNDGGSTWSQMNGGLPNADVNAVSILPNGRWLLGLGAGASTNAGNQNFYPGGIYYADSGASAWSAASAPTNTQQSVFWQIAVKSSGLLAFGASPLTGNGTAVGILKSADNGANWTALANPLPGLAGAYIDASPDLQTIYADLRSGGNPPLFYKSTNGGTSWSNPAAVSSSVDGPVRIVGSDPLVALAGTGNKVIRTTNGFASVSQISLPGSSGNNYVMAIEVAPSDPNIVYATTKGLLVYRSTDGGQSFSLRSNIRSYIDAQP